LLPGPLFLRTRLPANLPVRQRQCYHALQSLQSAGATCCITNIPSRRLRVPQAGRSHIKAAVVGRSSYVGGCNLSKPQELDVMVRFQDEAMAKTLAGWLACIAEAGTTRQAFQDVDTECALSGGRRLLLDAGVPGQSLVYDEALELIDTAKEWIYLTCQYFPGGTTAKHLAAAQARGVAVHIAHSHPAVHGPQAPFHHLYRLRERVRHSAPLFSGQLSRKTPNIHAKILASERGVLVGSHNYVVQGVALGTAELALFSPDPDFAQALRAFMEAQLAT
jgi:phosphatidylserine/phosphatidylglycerophosphate/cardiolipin synthase-like enzyme